MYLLQTVSKLLYYKYLNSKYFIPGNIYIFFYLGIFRDVLGRVIELGRKEAIESTATGKCVSVDL